MGVVLITVIVVSLFILALGLAQSFFGTQVSNLALRGSTGGICEDLAESAIANAYFAVASRINASGGDGAPYYADFRKNLGSFDLTVPKEHLSSFYSTCLAEWADYELVDDVVTGRVLYQIPAIVNSGLADVDPLKPGCEDETIGTLQFTARVRHDKTGVVRTVTHCYPFKKTLATVPRPFDFPTFAVLDPTGCLNAFSAEGDANKGIKLCVKTIRMHLQQVKDIIAACNEGIKKARKAEKKAWKKSDKKKAKRVRQAFEKIRDQYLVPLKADVPHIKVHAANESYSPDPRELHYFPLDGDDRSGGAMYIHSAESEIELETLNLFQHLYDQQLIIDACNVTAKAAYDRLKQGFDQANSSQNPEVVISNGSLPDWCAEVRKSWKAYEDMLLKVYRDFQERVVETAKPSKVDGLRKAFRALSPRAMLAKTTVRFVEGGTRDMSRKVGDFLDRKCDGAFSGMIYVGNPSQELVLDRTFKGRLVLFVEGDVQVRRVERSDPAKDMVTIIAGGTLSLKGPTEANLVVLGRFANEVGTRIQGNLVISKFGFANGSQAGVLDEASQFFKGKVVFNEKTPSGSGSGGVPNGDVYRDALTVNLGPDVVFKAVQRK